MAQTCAITVVAPAATVNSLSLHTPSKKSTRRAVSIRTALAIAFASSMFAPLAGAHHSSPECCDPEIRLTGVEEPLPDYPGLYDFPFLGPAFVETRDSVNANYRDLRFFAYTTSTSLFGPALPVNPIPHYTTQYHGTVTVDVLFPADCDCEVTDAWITWREIADGNPDPFVPFLTQIDGDTWTVSDGDWDTYEITFHATYECENGPGGTITQSWIQYN